SSVGVVATSSINIVSESRNSQSYNLQRPFIPRFLHSRQRNFHSPTMSGFAYGGISCQNSDVAWRHGTITESGPQYKIDTPSATSERFLDSLFPVETSN